MPLEYVEYWEKFKKDFEELVLQNKKEDEKRKAEEELSKAALQEALQRSAIEKSQRPSHTAGTAPESPADKEKLLSPIHSPLKPSSNSGNFKAPATPIATPKTPATPTTPSKPFSPISAEREEKENAEFFESALKLITTGCALAIEAREAARKQRSIRNSPSAAAAAAKSESAPAKSAAESRSDSLVEIYTASMIAKQDLIRTIESQFLKPESFDKYSPRLKKLAFIYRVHLRRFDEVSSENVRLNALLQNDKKDRKKIADAWEAKFALFLDFCKQNKNVLPSPIPVPSKQISRSRSSTDGKGFLGMGSLASGFSSLLLWGAKSSAKREEIESIAEEAEEFFDESDECVHLDLDASYLYKHRTIAKQLQNKFTQELWPELLLKTLNWYSEEILKIDTSFVDFLNKNHEQFVPKRKRSTGSALVEPVLKISVHEFQGEEDPTREMGWDGFASRAHADWVSKGYIANSIIQTELNKVKDEISKKVLEKCLLVQELYTVSKNINKSEREENKKLKEFSKRERTLYFKDKTDPSKQSVPILPAKTGVAASPGNVSAGMPVLALPSLPLSLPTPVPAPSLETSLESPIPVDDSFKKIDEERRDLAIKLSETAKTQKLKVLEDRLEAMEKAENAIMSAARFNAIEDPIAAKIKILESLQKLYFALFSHEQQCYAFQFNINDKENGNKYFEVLKFCIEVINEAIVVFELDPRFATPLSQIQKRMCEYQKEMEEAVSEYHHIRVDSGTPVQAKFEPKLFLYINQKEQRIKKLAAEASKYTVDSVTAPFLPTFEASLGIGFAARTVAAGHIPERGEELPDLEKEALRTEKEEPAEIHLAVNTEMFGTKPAANKSDKVAKKFS